MPITGISGNGAFCQEFDLAITGTEITWVDCFESAATRTSLEVGCVSGGCGTVAPALSCSPTGHVTNPPDGVFFIAPQLPYCGAPRLGSNQIYAGFPTNGSFNAVCTEVGTSAPTDAGFNECP
jgi:hypothetical protein